MADWEAARRSSLPSSVRERQHKSMATEFKDFLLTLSGKRKIQNPDEELGFHGAPDLVASPLSRSFGSNDDFMLCQRFGWLHARALLYQREHELRDVQEGQVRSTPDRRDQHNPFQESLSRNSLQQEMREWLSTHDSMILSMRSLRESPKPGVRRYQSIRDYLWHGPSIHLNYSEARDPHWTGYGKVVKRILEHPETAPWLDSPLDQDSPEATNKYLNRYGGDVAADPSYTTLPCTTIAAPRNLSTHGGPQFIEADEPLGNNRPFTYYTHKDCITDPSPFTRKCEKVGQRNKLDRPQVSKERDSEDDSYFTSTGGLANYQREAPERHQAWTVTMKPKLDKFAESGGILFWISHITAALSFLVVANPGQEPNVHPTVDWLLGYWYLTAISLVVHGVLAKGYVYARKVFLGGTLACVGGFYVLNVLWHVPTASIFTASPTLITIILLLIRTL